MELRQLRYLVALGEERHFTRAAARLGIAQPALSQQIRRLESQVGMTLVERTTRSVALTVAGETLVAGARRILREVDAAADELRALRGLETGRIVIGVTRTPGAVDVAALLGRFHRAHPGVELDVREDLSVALIALLEADALDLALIAEGPVAAPASLDVRPLAAEPLVAIVSPLHRLADHGEIELADLREERLVTFRRGATIRGQLEERTARLGFVPRVAFETDDVSRARALVAQDLAVSVLPASDARQPGAGVVVVPLADEQLVHRTAIAVRRGRHLAPAAAAFLAAVEADG